MTHERLAQLTASIDTGNRQGIHEEVERALADGLEPISILNDGLLPGMRIVGDKFATGEYFLPHLVVAAAAMKQAMAVLGPELKARHQDVRARGRVVIGTVRGDIHEIGKSLVATMLSAHGFEVTDLGVDVPIERFVSAVRETDANLVGMSALLTTTMGVQKQVIAALEAEGLRKQVRVMLGGAPVSRAWAEGAGADGFAEDAVSAVELAMRLTA